MKSAVEQIAAGAGLEKFAVWCDYTSISQKHPKLQRLAIASLPMYAAYCDVFVAVAPTAVHHDHGCTMDLEDYCKRGFCRVEMLSKLCGSGSANSYVMQGTGGLLRPFPLESLSFFVFEGQFTIESDKELLVVPALGLYSLIIRQKDLPHMREIYDLVQKHKERFFPPDWTQTAAEESRAPGTAARFGHRVTRAATRSRFRSKGGTSNSPRELFGTRLVELLEEYVGDIVARKLERRSRARPADEG
mmetsp:Transcript_7837/g.25838  ORF Transcript_7837/g.25838 Transcript_7837/m.25838 type:complete len:246 (+) Transcript_7837:2191-2928(+)